MGEQLISTNLVYRGEFVSLWVDKVVLDSGETIDREIVKRINGVAVVPLVKNGGNYDAVLIRKYNPAFCGIVYGLAGGGIDKADNNPEGAAERELLEETEYKARRLEMLFETKGSEAIRQIMSYFIGWDAYRIRKPRKNPKEVISVHKVNLDDAVKMAFDGKFSNPAFAYAVIKADKVVKERAVKSL